MLIGKTPLRLSFAGGGTDLAEYYEKYEGKTITFTMDKFTYVVIKFRNDGKFQGFSPDFASHHPPKGYKKLENIQGHEIAISAVKELGLKRGIDIFFCSDVAPGSGLGASSALATNLVNVIQNIKNDKLSKKEIANKAYEIAHDVLKWSLGKQDEFSSVYGGLNCFTFTKDNVKRESLNLKKSTYKELQSNSLLFNLRTKRPTDLVLKSQINNIKKSKSLTMNSLHKTKELAEELRDALKNDNLTEFGEIINKGWQVKRKISEGITNKTIDKLISHTLSLGAEGAKITGAGGGGHLYVYAEPSKHDKIIKQLQKLDAIKVKFNFQYTGATIIDTNDI